MDLPRGMKDFENSEFSKIEFVREKFLETSKVFGYKLMEPSPIESLSTLEAKSGESIKDDIYFFTDKGEREIALRFDFTVGLTRYAVSQKSMKLPAKISAFGGVWRYDEPQKGRYRFFHQWDIEIFGNTNLEYDAEIIEFTSKFFSNLGLENITIDISHRKLVQSYINEIFQEDNQQIVFDMLRAVDKIQKKSKQEIISEYEKKGYSRDKLEKIIEFSEITGTPSEILDKIDVSCFNGWDEITSVYNSLKNRNINNIQINLGIVRGLDYYSGIVFEAFGRTDFGATGVAGGVERIILALENQNSKFKESEKRISVLYVNDQVKNHAIKIASSLRDKGIPVDIDLSGKSLKKQMEQSVNSKFAVIVAPNEFSSGMIVLRNMLDRSEKQVKVEDLMSELS